MLTHCLQLEEGLSAMRMVHSSQGLTRATGTQHKRRVEKRKKLMDSIKMIVTEQHKAGEGLSTGRCVEILDSVAANVFANKKGWAADYDDGYDGNCNQVEMWQGGYEDKRASGEEEGGEEEGSEEEAGPSTSANVRFLQGKDKQEKKKKKKSKQDDSNKKNNNNKNKKKSNNKQNQPESNKKFKYNPEATASTTEDDAGSDMCDDDEGTSGGHKSDCGCGMSNCDCEI